MSDPLLVPTRFFCPILANLARSMHSYLLRDYRRQDQTPNFVHLHERTSLIWHGIFPKPAPPEGIWPAGTKSHGAGKVSETDGQSHATS